MAKLLWDQTGQRFYETGVDHGVLYPVNNVGVYNHGYAWNGLTTVTESPSGAESNKQYADNRVYVNLLSVEEFNGTIEAFTYPDAFAECDGSLVFEGGVSVGQQARKTFGLSYRTKLGNDLDSDAGYKLHLVWGALAAPSEKAYATVNDSPEAITFSWEISTTAVEVGTVDGTAVKPTASMVIDSTKVDTVALGQLENLLYGTSGTDPQLPMPAAVIALFAGTIVVATPTAPTYNSTTHVITIPSITGVIYKINGEVVTGTVTITTDTIVTAEPAESYKFPPVSDDDWFYDYV